MSKVLAITVALMIAATVISPAMGYTNMSGGNQSYSVTSGSRVAYSIGTGVPAHNLTQDMVTSKYPAKSPAVQGTRVPYSFQQGTHMPYSLKLVGVESAVAEGTQAKEEQPTVSVEAPAAETAVEKLAIEGVVFDDSDGSGTQDQNETGLANWTVNLEQPAGTVISSATTDADGRFSFIDLAPGEYTVSEVVQMGWALISPAEGLYTVTLTNESVTGLAFANQILPATPVIVTPPANITEAINTTAA